MSSLRLIIDPPLSGAENMGRDEALLQACNHRDFRPVLRFYEWSPATISLGYFQDFEEAVSLSGPLRDLPVVRRTTGGGAILHDMEVTYSLVLPIDHLLIRGRPTELYRVAHSAVIAAIGNGARLFGNKDASCGGSAQRGPFFCFARRHDLDVVLDDGKGAAKVAGSAQRRTPTAILQHGSIILDSRYAAHPVARWRDVCEHIDSATAVRRLAAAFERALGMSTEPGEWTPRELEIGRAYADRYASEAWTVHREREALRHLGDCA